MNLHTTAAQWKAALLLCLVATLVACGGGESTTLEATPNTELGHEHAFVDGGGVYEATAQERMSAEIQDMLADKLQAQREAASTPFKVDLSPYAVQYADGPVLTQSGHFEMAVKSDAYPLIPVQIVQQVQTFPAYGASFNFTNITIYRTAAGAIQLRNNTPRAFRQMLWRKANGAMLAMDFGAQTVLPFSTNTLNGDGLAGTERFYDTAPLFRANYHFQSNLREPNGCAGVSYCARKGTTAEQRRLENSLAAMKLAYNTYGLASWGSERARSSSCLSGGSYSTQCGSMGGNTELYMWTQIAKMALHPRGSSGLGFLVNYGNTVGLATVGGSGGFARFAPPRHGDLNVVHHEIAHNYGYDHNSAMTYGFSEDLANRLLSSKTINPFTTEYLPKRAVVATPTNTPNTWVISVLAAQAEASKPMRFMMLARERGFMAETGRIEGNTQQFVLKLTKKPTNPFAIRIYPDADPNPTVSKQPSHLVGSVLLSPL
ncbi:MAG: hypothetical protein RL297_1721 [Pseudomonadota bacterium]|jgi:hypothetical protein